MKPNKYRNKPTEVDGIRFASKLEAKRYRELKQLVALGEIEDLKLQPRYKLHAHGAPICEYRADFSYTDLRTGEVCVEDAKGVITPEFKIKSKLFEAQFKRPVQLITR